MATQSQIHWGQISASIALVFILMGNAYLKYNLVQEDWHCKSKMWWLYNKGLSHTGKGKKEETGGRSAGFFVDISHKKGLVLCNQYFGKLSQESFCKNNQEGLSGKYVRTELIPQTSSFYRMAIQFKIANRSFDVIGYKVFTVPAR